jgi:WD40 repeat protein
VHAPTGFRYHAFISYSHAHDRELARRLQRAVQAFGKRWYEPRSLLVYRDETNLSVTPHLWPSIQEALAGSEFFILLASPKAAASEWVQREVTQWLESGRAEKLLIVVTGGVVAWDAKRQDFDWSQTTALPRVVSGWFADEPLYLDLTWARESTADLSLRNAGFRSAVVSLAARISGRELHELDSEEVRRHRSVVRLVWTAATTLAVVITIAAIAGVLYARQREITRSDLLAASAQSQLAWNPERALALALEAAEAARTPRSDQTLRQAMARAPVLSVRTRAIDNPRVAITGPWLLAAGNGTVERWPLDSARASPPLRGELSADGRALLRNATARSELRRPSDDRLVAAFPEERFETFSTDGTLFATSGGESLRIRAARDGRLIATIPAAGRSVRDTALSGDGEHLVIAFDEHPPMVRRLRDGQTSSIAALLGVTTFTTAFDPAGQLVVFGTDHGVSAWSLDGSRMHKQLRHGEEFVERFAFSPDGRRIITAGGDGYARIWSWPAGEPLAALQGDTYGVGEAAFSSDGRVIVTWTWGHAAQVWDGENYRRLQTFGNAGDPIANVVFDAARHVLAIAHRNGVIRLWNVDALAPVRRYTSHRFHLTSVVLSRDQRRLITASADETAKMLDIRGGAVLRTFRHTAPRYAEVTHATFSPDGKWVATSSIDRTAAVWDANSGSRLRTLGEHTKDVNWVEFSPDGRLIATASMDGTARIWNAATGAPVAAIGPLSNSVESVRFDRNSTRIVLACGDNIARIRTIAGKPGRDLRGHTDIVRTAMYSPDDTRILTASDDGTARVWDAATGALLLILGHPDAVHSAEFNKDGALIVTATGFNPVAAPSLPPDGNVVRIWDAATGQLVDEIRAHATLVSSATFGDDGTVLTACWDNTARLFRPASTVSISDLLTEARQRIARYESIAPPRP